MLLGALWSASLADLDDDFERRVQPIIAALESAGFHPTPSCTWRSSDVQDVIASAGSATQARGGQSCHNRTLAGAPTATAIDLWDGSLSLGLIAGDANAMAAQVPFLQALGRAAKAAGLEWGGDWHGHASAWDAYALGWDPAHIQRRGCR